MAATPEQPKKPAGGAFGRFMAEKRSEFMKQCEGKPVSEVTKLGGAEWKKLSEEEKAPYQKQFEEAQKKYATDMEAFLAAGGVKQKGAAALRTEKRKAKEMKMKKKDPNAPKRPAGGAYGCYMAAHREEFQKECPGSVTGVAKLASARWKALPEDQKEKYVKEYASKAAAYEEAKKNYVPPKGADADAGGDDAEAAEPPAKKARASSSGKKSTAADKKATAAATKGAEQAATAVKKAATSSAKGKAKAKAKAPVEEEVDIPKTVLAKAEKANMTEVLTKLMCRADIKNAGIAAGQALEALEGANGLLHPARRALLGA
eukprot:TRINITY_DN36922_c0_g1_i1.p1 TRINITY_DN36922_c0_g1~~TRINITY_DN36922_c0_g1_i1.p1  ORF type:complete len:317 (-),score=112.99 TRINITY_DN36922_c0_g1_i1:227-1177(-)